MFDIINRAIVNVQAAAAARQQGQAMVEYGLVAGLIAIVSIVAVTLVGTELDKVFDVIGVELGKVTP